MTIIAQLNTLPEAYAGMEALRQKAIPPSLSRSGDYLVISVDDDFAENARSILSSCVSNDCLRKDASNNWISFDEFNA